MLQHSITKDEIMELAHTFVEGLSPNQEADKEHVANALGLYRSGLVYNVDFDGYTLSGTAEADGTIYSVNIPIQKTSESYCDCFSATQCEHMLAVLLSAASSFGKVGDVLTLFKKKNKPALPPIRTARQVLQTTLFEETDYESWLVYFEKEYDSYKAEQTRLSYKQMYFLMNIFSEFYMRIERKAPRIVTVHELFKLNAALFCFEKLLQEIEEFEEKGLYSYHQPVQIVRLFVDKIDGLIRDLRTESLSAELQPVLQETARAIHCIFFATTSYIPERFFLYHYAWHELLFEESLIKEEKVRIDQKMQPVLKALAHAHLLFLQKQDDEAIEILSKQTPRLVHLYFHWLEDLLHSMQWDRAKRWLSFTYNQVKETMIENSEPYFIKDIVQMFVKAYEAYANQMNEQAGYEMILQELLPYSFDAYEHYLLAKEQYHTWTELHLFYGFDAIECLKEPLKEVEKAAPEAALPLYHIAVVNAIDEKNRKSYRRAVRYLKKLRTLYKKLKRTDEWQTYIIMITSSHSRLRALQEEMRKGKLIDDNIN